MTIDELRKATPLTIFLIEDDDGDAKAVKRAFSKEQISNPIIRAKDGVEALNMLRDESSEGIMKSNIPFVMLIDLNMPRMGGHELITEIRKDSRLKHIIAFVLTTSKSEEDKMKSYALNVAGYILKERAGRDFLKLTRLFDAYVKLVELPNTSL
tara:strand:+ start:22895 stop:23356 length:462 start_codon:yes stop_codon:yes gene_type:complete